MVANTSATSMNGEEPQQEPPEQQEQLRLSSSDASSAASSLLFASSFPNETPNGSAAAAPSPMPLSSSPLPAKRQLNLPDEYENEAQHQQPQDPPALWALSSEGASVERSHDSGNSPEAQVKRPEQKQPPAPEPAPPSLSSSERSSTKSNGLRFSFLYPKHEQRENAHRSASLPAGGGGNGVTSSNDEGSSNEPRPRSLSVPERIEMNSEERLRHRRREIRQRRRQSQQLLEQITLERERRRRISEYQFNYSRTDYPVRELKFKLPFGIVHPVMINPLVTGIAIVWLWGLVVWAASEPTHALTTLLEWRTWIALKFSWFYQGTTAFFFFFMIYILFRYGHVHLGHPDTINDPPEFTTLSYMCMCFTSGIASGFFAVSVSQTIWNQQSHFYANAGYRSQDELDMFAINMTVTQWGFAGWTKYLVVAVNMSLAVHCFQLPMTIRSCFYPILRHYTWGWMGDWIDGLAIVASITGVAVSMGLGAVQIVSGFIYMGWVDRNASQQQISSIQAATIWLITVLFTASTLSGLHGGVRFISKVALSCNFIFTFLVFALDDSKFLLNLMVQEFGYYFQYSIFQLNFWTDAFGQLREGSGRAIDGKAADQNWMDETGVFYAAWWVAWAPFVGVFTATISKGRKVRDVVLYGLFVPVGYCLVFFCVMGGVGLRQARQALELQQVGAVYFNNSNHFLASNSGICYDVPQNNVVIDDVTVFTNRLYGVTPVCLFDNDNADYGAYNIFYSFRFPDTFSGHGMGTTLSLLFIFASMLHSVRSCDTVSLVVDSLASTGRKNSHWSRRMFWSITIGALAAALLSTGGRTALRAVQAASVLCGLPFSVVLCYMLQCILLMCRAADQTDRLSPRYTFPDQAEFSMPLYGGIFNILEYMASLGKVNAARVELGMHRPSKRQVIEFGKGLIVPYVSLYQVLSSTYPESAVSNACLATLYMTCFFGWIGCLSAARGDRPELAGIGWTLFVATGGILCHVRSTFRAKYRIRSNVFADVLSSCFLWPQVLTQMLIHSDAVSSSSKPKPKEDRPTG